VNGEPWHYLSRNERARLVIRHRVADACGRIRDDDRRVNVAVDGLRITALRVVVVGSGRGLGDAVHVGPLLDGLAEVVVAERGVLLSVPQHHWVTA
jgi:hypothetical protein